ncbi:glutathione S-transferase C-terminal-like protein [Gyrodon lividus]|nr:glutathione S-transferase C-terminal-like protein [Gyrodon lividus]
MGLSIRYEASLTQKLKLPGSNFKDLNLSILAYRDSRYNMAPIGTLWGLAIQRQSKVILAAAAVAGLELDTPAVDFAVTNKTPEYLTKFPMGKIPAFDDNKGFKLFEGAAIARYVSSLAPEAGLLGKNANEAALVDQWVHFGENEIAMFSYETMALVAGYLGPYSKELHTIMIQKQARSLKVLDEHLAFSNSGFLIADKMTLADIALAAVSQQAGRLTCGAAERALYPNVFAHYEKVTAYAKIKAVFGEAEFVEEAMAYKAA